jgi:stage II sporulation protein M
MNFRAHHFLPYFLTSALLFVASTIAGFFGAMLSPTLREYILVAVESVVNPLSDLSRAELMWAIFSNNSIKTLKTMIFGAVLGVYPVIAIVINGLVIGVVMYLAAVSHGWGAVAITLVPHGIIELPAFLFAGAVGMMIGVLFVRRIAGKEQHVLPKAFSLIISSIIILIPLLFLAAFIEAYITPALAEWYLAS